MTNKIRVMNQTATLQIPKTITRGKDMTIEVKVDEQTTVHSVMEQWYDQVDDTALRARLFDSRGDPSKYLTVMLNGKNIAYKDGIDTVVKGSDQVYVIPVVSGGSI